MRHQVTKNTPTGSPYSLPKRLRNNIILGCNSGEGFLLSQGSYPCDVIEVETEAEAGTSFDGEKVTVKRFIPDVEEEEI